jgi:hypothetical protein
VVVKVMDRDRLCRSLEGKRWRWASAAHLYLLNSLVSSCKPTGPELPGSARLAFAAVVSN